LPLEFILPLAALAALAAIVSAQSGTVGSLNGKPDARLSYPSARRGEQVDDYHGTKVSDPYRWLEDLDSAETKAWVEAENRLTFDFLKQIPERAAIKARLMKLWNYERYDIPLKEGGRYFYKKNDGLQNQSVLYTVDTLEGQPSVLLDPNRLASDGTVALADIAITDDGKLMAYGLAASGSDWSEWRVRDVQTGRDLPDVIKYVKFSGASWTPDGKGFFYSRYEEAKTGNKLAAVNEYHKLYYHRLGTEQAEDVLVYSSSDEREKGWLFQGQVTEDGRYLIIWGFPGSSSENRIYYKDLQQKDAPVVKLLDDEGVAQYFIGNDGPVFWFLTDRDAPHKKIIAVDTRAPERKDWKVVVAEAKETLDSVTVVGDHLIASYLKDAHTQVKLYDTKGRFVREVELPGIGTATGFNGKRKDKETFYSFTGFTTPTTVYRYDTASGKSTIFRQPRVDFNPNDYETRQVFYTSKDGTRVPMFITHRKGLKLDGKNPTYLYGYGGFDVSMTPAFSVSNLVWMEMGGVYAVANLRGGGEYG
jgi:prolyl oligopeptidase